MTLASLMVATVLGVRVTGLDLKNSSRSQRYCAGRLAFRWVVQNSSQPVHSFNSIFNQTLLDAKGHKKSQFTSLLQHALASTSLVALRARLPMNGSVKLPLFHFQEMALLQALAAHAVGKAVGGRDDTATLFGLGPHVAYGAVFLAAVVLPDEVVPSFATDELRVSIHLRHPARSNSGASSVDLVEPVLRELIAARARPPLRRCALGWCCTASRVWQHDSAAGCLHQSAPARTCSTWERRWSTAKTLASQRCRTSSCSRTAMC